MNSGILFIYIPVLIWAVFYILMHNNNRDILYFNFYLQGLLPK
jgi:hypothetical protein